MFEVDFKILNQKATPAIYADVTAAIPTPGFVGRLFIATDSPHGVFRDTGTAWVQVASNGGGGGSSTGINGLNGTTNIGLGGTLTSNTTIQGSFDFTLGNFQNINISSLLPSGISGINLNGPGYYSVVGDILSTYQTYFFQQTRRFFTTFAAAEFGLNLDDNTGRFCIGDYSNQRKYNAFVVNDDTNEFYINTSYNQVNNNEKDLFFVSNNPGANERFVKLGDFNSYTNDTYLIIDDFANTLITSGINGIAGLNFDFSTEKYELGSNNSKIICDNSNNQIDITSLNIILSTTPSITTATITNTATATIPTEYLSININGVAKKIQILNP
jgi:hypothetical protein